MIWNTVFVESGRRPAESVDTSRPAEDSRQNGISAATGGIGISKLWQFGAKNAVSNAFTTNLDQGKLNYTGVGRAEFNIKGYILNTAINTAVDGAMFKLQNPKYSFTDNQYDRALRLPNKNRSKAIFNEYQSKSNSQTNANNAQTGVGISTGLINKSVNERLKKNKAE